MPKLKPAKIFGLRYMGKFDGGYNYWPNGYEHNPYITSLLVKRFPTAERIKKMFENAIGFRNLVD